MNSLADFIPQLGLVEWGQIVLWVGMLGITLVSVKPANMLAKGITSLVMMTTRLGGRSEGERLRVGSRVGFDIDKTYLDEVITFFVIILVFLVVFVKTSHCFPNRIHFG